MAFCKIMLIGNLGRDPEMRYTPERPPRDPVQRRGQQQQARRPGRLGRRGHRLVSRQRLRRSGRARGRAAPQGQPRLRRGSLQDPRVRGQRRPEADLARRDRRQRHQPRPQGSRRRRRLRGRPGRRRRRWRGAAVAAAPPGRPPTTPTSTTFPSDQETYDPCLPSDPKKRDDFYRDRRRRKVCAFCADKTVQIDYKEVNRLRRYLSERAKIEPRRKTGTCAGHQRELAVALKRARHVALLPYAPQHLRP